MHLLYHDSVVLSEAHLRPAAGSPRHASRVEVPRVDYEKATMQQMHLNAWAYHRILKLARTIADLTGSETIQTAHTAEAIQYRPRRMV